MDILVRFQFLNFMPLVNISLALVFCVLGFTFAFQGWGWLVWLTPIFLGFAAINRPTRFCAGTFALFSTLSWICIAHWLPLGINSMNPSYPIFGYLTLLLLALLSAIPYLLFGLIAGKYRWFGQENPSPVKAAALLCLLIELWPARLPGTLGNALFLNTLIIQIVDLGGTGVLSFVVYSVGFLIAKLLILDPNYRERSKTIASLLTFFIGVTCYGYLQLSYWSEFRSRSTPIRIALMQPNLPLEHVSTPNSSLNSIDSLISQTKEITEANPQLALVVWPEIPLYFSPHNILSHKTLLDKLLSGSNIPLLANADSYSNEQVFGRVPFYNTVQLFKGSGEILQEYRKMILVPFGEYLPFEEWLTFPSLKNVLTDFRRYVPGNSINLIEINRSLIIGSPICLEAHHTELLGEMVRMGANVLVNPANDAYFGTSKGAEVDLALSIFRSIEYRIPLIRVTNSGISAAINQSGEIIDGSVMPQFTAAQRIVEVFPSSQKRLLIPKVAGMVFMLLITIIGLIGSRLSSRKQQR